MPKTSTIIIVAILVYFLWTQSSVGQLFGSLSSVAGSAKAALGKLTVSSTVASGQVGARVQPATRDEFYTSQAIDLAKWGITHSNDIKNAFGSSDE